MKQLLLNFIISIIAKTWQLNPDFDLPKENAIYGFWHGKMLPVWYHFRNDKPFAVISLSKDGSLLSGLLEKWGYKVRRGSSSKGGKQVLDRIIEDVKQGKVLITPDGPRGPIHKLKAGIIVASQRSNIPFYFISVVVHNKKIFQKSWDKFELPLPFSKIDLNLNGPYKVPEEYGREDIDKLVVKFNKTFAVNMESEIGRDNLSESKTSD